MSTEQSELRVRIERELRARLDAFCRDSHRNLTNAVGFLLDEVLAEHGYRRQDVRQAS